MLLKTVFCSIGILLASFVGIASEPAPEVRAPKPVVLKKNDRMLNVVYFLGNDAKPVPDYERRISELLLHLQQFYGSEMKRNGFGPRSFGLDMKSPGRVNIIVYKAKNSAKDYPYENGGGWKALQEVEEYFKLNPELKKSSHILIITPTWNDEKNNDLNPGGVPFYGIGRNCFALDYPAFDLKHIGQNTPEGHLLTKWYGGLAHELGHGLNLPHNHATTTQGKKLGTALMGAGNYTFGMKPTFLTPASCAILDTCEAFSTIPGKNYYTGASPVDLPKLKISFPGNKIAIAGSYRCKDVVNALNIYVQDEPYAVNQDYDAVAFSKRLNKKTGSFSLSIDRNELEGLEKNTFQVRLMFILQNGELVRKDYEFHKDNLKEYVEPQK